MGRERCVHESEAVIRSLMNEVSKKRLQQENVGTLTRPCAFGAPPLTKLICGHP